MNVTPDLTDPGHISRITPHCPITEHHDPDRCVWCDDLRREHYDGRAVDQ